VQETLTDEVRRRRSGRRLSELHLNGRGLGLRFHRASTLHEPVHRRVVPRARRPRRLCVLPVPEVAHEAREVQVAHARATGHPGGQAEVGDGG
jgi:hypothetical protein